MARKKMSWLDIVAVVLLIAGGLAWGLLGFFNYEIFRELLASSSRWVYMLVGIASVYSMIVFTKLLIKK